MSETGTAASAAPGRSRASGAVPTLLVAPLVLMADLGSKAAARSVLEPGEAIRVVGGLVQLRLGFNSGIAFGLADGGAALAWITALIAIALVGWLALSVRARASWHRTVPLGLIIGGAFGNVLDRLPDGRVTDFIDIGLRVTRWPSFNVADATIVVGVLALIVLGRDDEPSGNSGPDS